MSSNRLEFKRRISVSSDQAYRAFTHAPTVRGWLCPVAEVDARPGGRFYLWWQDGCYAAGEFTAVERNRELSLTWRGRSDPGESQLRLSFTVDGSSTLVELVHQGFGAGDDWAVARERAAELWREGLENLQSVLETGEDLRIVNQPTPGFEFRNFDVDGVEFDASKLGVPVKRGILVDEVLDGLGADEAGLRPGDVIVEIDGKTVTRWPRFPWANVLPGYRPGDRIELSFFRGQERRTTAMTLSQRRCPEVPDTIDEFAELVRLAYVDLRDGLASCLAGLTEEQAAFHPFRGWSVLDTVGHLIHGEMTVQVWLDSLVNGSDAQVFGRNIKIRTDAIIATNPTVAGLAEQLEQLRQQTLAYVSLLPPEFAAWKPTWWRFAFSVLQSFDHTRQHLKELRVLVDDIRQLPAARSS